MSMQNNAKQCSKTELLERILELKRQRKTNKEIALLLQCHRNTITKYVKQIRLTIVKTPEEIINKIDSKLNDELEVMEHRDLINYRRVLLPQRIEAKVESKNLTIIKMWQPNDSRTGTDSNPAVLPVPKATSIPH